MTLKSIFFSYESFLLLIMNVVKTNMKINLNKIFVLFWVFMDKALSENIIFHIIVSQYIIIPLSML